MSASGGGMPRRGCPGRDGCDAYTAEDGCICPFPGDEKCRPIEIDGEVIRVRGEREMNDRDREMFAEVVAAAKRHLAENQRLEATDG